VFVAELAVNVFVIVAVVARVDCPANKEVPL
jgi:hypothetical protein